MMSDSSAAVPVPVIASSSDSVVPVVGVVPVSSSAVAAVLPSSVIVAAPSVAAAASSSPAAVIPAWEELSAVEQVLALTDEELQETIVRCWIRPQLLSSMVESWSMSDCRRVGIRLNMMPSSSVAQYRRSIRRVMMSWAEDHPTWLDDTDVEEERVVDDLRTRRGRARSTITPSVSNDTRRMESSSPPVNVAGVLPPPSARNPPVNLNDQAALTALLHLPAVNAGSASPRRVAFQSTSAPMVSAATVTTTSRSVPVAAASSSSSSTTAAAAAVAAPRVLSYDPDYDTDSEDEELGLELGVGIPSTRARRFETAVNMEALGISAPFAAPYLDNVLRGQATDSVLRVFKALEFNHTRNRSELLALAKVVDFARKGDTTMVIEWACRRMAGVHTADQSGNWRVSDVFEMNTAAQSYVPSSFLQMALKQVARTAAISKTHHSSDKTRQGSGGGKSSGFKSKSYGAGGGTSGGYSSSSTPASAATKPSGSNKK